MGELKKTQEDLDDDEEETFCSLNSEINPFWGAEGMHAHLFSLLVFGHVTWVVRRCDEKLETRIPKQARAARAASLSFSFKGGPYLVFGHY